MLSVVVKWSGKEYAISNLAPSDTVADLKRHIAEETQVLPSRQKLLNLKHQGKPAGDDVPLSSMNIQAGFKIMMMGSREEAIARVMEEPGETMDILDDFEIGVEVVSIPRRAEYVAKVEKRIKEYQLKTLNEPRDGKKLLVLDIDYTLFDHKSTASNGMELMRPHLHEFLTTSYKYYDLVIWSATSMKWIEEKMKILGVAAHSDYKILCYVDDLAMISVHVDGRGVVNCKPLAVIWGKFPERYSASNTIMFDDCSHNFLMNPSSGLKIRPFRLAHLNRDTDRELVYLKRYLRAIRTEEDLSSLNHKKWRRFLRAKEQKKHKQRDALSSAPTEEEEEYELPLEDEDISSASEPPPPTTTASLPGGKPPPPPE